MKTIPKAPALPPGAQIKSLDGLEELKADYVDSLGQIRIQITQGFAASQESIPAHGMNWLRQEVDWDMASRAFGFRDGDRPQRLAGILVPLSRSDDLQLGLEAMAVKGTTYLRHSTRAYGPRLGYSSIALTLRSDEGELIIGAPVDDRREVTLDSHVAMAEALTMSPLELLGYLGEIGTSAADATFWQGTTITSTRELRPTDAIPINTY